MLMLMMFCSSFSDSNTRGVTIFCLDLYVFDIPEFTGRNPFPTFSFSDFDRTKIIRVKMVRGFF
jgi:hypothetical protein